MSNKKIHGTVAPEFEEVEAAFRENFARRGELGGACAIYHREEKVVDLWGGVADETSGRPWAEDTMVLVFSATKGMAAVCLALAHSHGWLEYDEKVATYWPEFGAGGKHDVTVRQLLAHQAGLCAIDAPMDVAMLADLDAVAAAVAPQVPAWEPGTRHGYHAVSLGWYVGELIRRVDPQARSLGRFFQDEITRPLGIDFHVGLPPDVPGERVATIKAYKPVQLLFHIHQMPFQMVRAILKSDSLTARAFNNPRIEDFNVRAVQEVEIPAGNGIGTARAIARVYGDLATGGRALRLRPETMGALIAPPIMPAAGAHDEVLKVKTAYSLGFLRPSPHRRFGRGLSSFGATGAGGAFGFADPEAQIGFAYATNKMGFHLRNEPRERALHDACYRCLAGLK